MTITTWPKRRRKKGQRSPVIELDVQYAPDSESDGEPPSPGLIERWVKAALHGRRGDAELAIRIVGKEEIQQLNRTYRHKDAPTNVLSFPFDAPPGVELPMLGDIAICAPVVRAEALAQGKAIDAHWAHMVIHGVLHLLGYDHIVDAEAQVMEALEVEILAGLGYADPYAVAVN